MTTCANHVPDVPYLSFWYDCIERVTKGYRQEKCDECGLWKIWVKDTKSEAKFRREVRALLKKDIKPTPKLLKGLGYGNGRTLGGNLSKIRRDEFTLAEWVEASNGRWVKQREHALANNA